jgi:hypothetical protein
MIAKRVPVFDNHPKLVWFRSLSFFQEGEPTSSWGEVLTLQVMASSNSKLKSSVDREICKFTLSLGLLSLTNPSFRVSIK